MNDKKELNAILESSEQTMLEEIEGKIGTRQVTRRDLEGVPDWITKKYMDREVEGNWAGVTEEVEAQDMPVNENLL